MRGEGEGGGVNTEHALDWLSGWSPPYKECIYQIPGSIEGPIHLLKTGDNISDCFFLREWWHICCVKIHRFGSRISHSEKPNDSQVNFERM